MFGNPETTTGGRALKFYSTVRLEVRRAEQLNKVLKSWETKRKLKLLKIKWLHHFRTAEVDIMYGEGISKEGEIIDIGAEFEIVEKSGSWYSYNGDRIGQGRENAKLFLKENKRLRKK